MSVLERLDMSKRLDKPVYKDRLLKYQLELRDLAYEVYVQQQSVVVVYEGWDAAGKGGSIRRATAKLDPRGYHVYSIGAPEGTDLKSHYQRRFWRRLRPPEDKQIFFFDRSWYGRVLVERVEGFATPDEWQRAYGEINDFERQLTDAGWVVIKLWVHITKDEQATRFEARRTTRRKRWKLTEEDWRNREKWDAYEEAVEDMLARTSTKRAPWTVVEGNDKYYARVKSIRTLVRGIRRGLENE